MVKARKKTSQIWAIGVDKLRQIVNSKSSFSLILKEFGLNNIGGNLRTLRNRLDHENIDYSHIRRGIDSNRGRTLPKSSVPLSEIMVENSAYSRSFLKKRLIREGILKPVCKMCQQGTIWNGQPLVLVLDHRNGIRDDNRIDNLRLLCPNCNSQTATFAGRNFKGKGKKNPSGSVL